MNGIPASAPPRTWGRLITERAPGLFNQSWRKQRRGPVIKEGISPACGEKHSRESGNAQLGQEAGESGPGHRATRVGYSC